MADDFRSMINIDRIIHEPARLIIVAILYAVENADFLYLLREMGRTKGNLSSHLSRLEDTGYVDIEKTFHGKIPRTICRLTDSGRAAFDNYRGRIKHAIGTMPEESLADEGSTPPSP